MRIHLFGASGSGCSSLGARLANQLGISFVDSDDFYWQRTDPPFSVRAEHKQRNAKLLATLHKCDQWVLAGSISSWDLGIEAQLSLAIFVQVPTEERMLRLQSREILRYGSRVQPGGVQYKSSQAFLAWSKSYDDGGRPGRSLAKHQAWFTLLPCPKLVFANQADIDQSAKRLYSLVKNSMP